MKARAQNPQAQAIGLIKQAMSAYGNLDLESSKRFLDQALSMSPQLTANSVARIYMSYGILFVGGQGDNARGQESFTIARCLDNSVQMDPLYSTPDIDMIFKMAMSRVNQQNCAPLVSNIVFSRGGVQPVVPQPQPMPQPMPQPQPMQPMVQPGAGMLPPCGMHTPPQQQRQSHELPLAVQLNPAMAPSLTKMVIKYAFDGGTTFFDAPMQKSGNGWATGMLTCVEGQLTAFNPSSIAYYIEGYASTGQLMCGHGNSTQPFIVTINPGAPVLAGLPGMPAPQACVECPPWDQDCLARSGKEIPCFADEECPSGVCMDTGFCEGSGGGGGEFEEPTKKGSGDVPRVFYFNITGGTGGGILSAKNSWWVDTATVSQNSVNDIYSYATQDVPSGGWGGLGLRATMGFNIKPVFALEVGFRFDVSAAWRTQKKISPCYDPHLTSDSNGYICFNPHGDQDGAYGVWGWQDGTDGGGNPVYKLYSDDERFAGKAWLINLRARYRFVNDGKMLVSFFGGLGYGHLFFAPMSTDVNFDGTADRKVVTPGGVNIELGPGFAYYFNPHVGFILEAPIDMAFGEDSTFGLNAEIALGLSFGG